MEMPQDGKIGKPPAVVIIARHGARIDAVDKEWHLTSPTPYDPPLTYGGWIQGRALGARIASLLKAREDSVHDETIPTTNSSASVASNSTSEPTSPAEMHLKPPRKTSVAISAGMSQFYRAKNEHSNDQTPVLSPLASEEISPMGTPLRSSTPTSSDPWNKLNKKDKLNHGKSTKVAPRTRLRIDAFLGEWLSPDYFDQITPPPGSVMMVAGAKAELLRRVEIPQRANNYGSNSFSGNFPGGWKSNQTTSSDTPAENTSFRMSSLADSLPSEGQLGTEDGLRFSRPVKAITIRDVLSRSPSHSQEDLSAGYIPPIPSYAISTSDPIPTGYVSHARDACVDVDYQWDSMKDPQNWGDGGEYDEEWSAMHKRFRNGLIKMVDWYSHEKPHKSHRHHHHHHHHHHHSHNHDDDEETDTVLVLVTHGAGCNALIGALTNQPVLIDVAMASLTMAVRKDIFKARTWDYRSDDLLNNDHTENHPSPSTLPLYHLYDLSLIASTEHLRVTSNPLSLPQLPSPTLERPRSISVYRHRTGSSPLRFSVNTLDNQDNKAARSYGLQRSATTNSAHHHYTSRSISGLWASKEKENSIDEIPGYQFEQRSAETQDSNMQPVADARSMLPSFQEQKKNDEERIAEQPKSQLGLWGSVAISQAREPALKRRWTVTEQHGR
ncbi:uncharacterized protein BHQ10_002567 [Talaromyces amestolkiae]|uniref:Uncharacterized protein n=1 Tax=Talaromyces amestolkiae TaxID=1196081 RepID=A0A364KSN1_TALAM|nr:uncharacterized protein BHQ10_002567 [Talaromyces amestolkiae]RAO66555.1 hypothetical protein BHQ10_002567 [Talaromyces amestolkiae]